MTWTEVLLEEVGKILPFVIGKNLQGSRLAEVLRALWPRAVGKEIARHSRPISFVSGMLTLATACPSWAAQLSQMSEELRAGINSFLGKPVVRKLRVRHAPGLILETANGKLESGRSALETGNWRRANGESKASSPDSKPALELAGLDPAIARSMEEAFAKYFSKASNRQRA